MEFLRILEERRFPAGRIRLTASHRSVGRRIPVRGQDLVVEETTPDAFEDVDIAFISATSRISLELGGAAVEAGALVIDDSSAFRMRPDVPLVVPEVNGEDVEWHQGIISIPNCATTPLVMAAQPLHRLNPVSRIIAATYQSVSGAGGAAMTELREQTLGAFQGTTPSPQAQPHRIAFNVIPRIDDFGPDGYTKEETKVREETRKIMHAPGLAVAATCVRVPVYISHSAAVHMEFQRSMDPDEARGVLAEAPGVTVVDAPEEGLYPMPVDVGGTDDVYVGRIRRDTSHPNGLVMWVVADNLRKGAALNAIQIAEEVLKRDCLKTGRKAVMATASLDLNGERGE
jgi:aspartate-semialdehyde dehydrogenase